jgi:hypothetical protein
MVRPGGIRYAPGAGIISGALRAESSVPVSNRALVIGELAHGDGGKYVVTLTHRSI